MPALRLRDLPARRASSKSSALRNSHRFRQNRSALCCAALLSAALVAAHPLTAQAGCGNRPGTPDLTEAFPVSSTEIRFRWRNTQREGGRYYDFELQNGSGQVLGSWAGLDTFPQNAEFGKASTKHPYHAWLDWPFTGLKPNNRYCIRVRARTAGGKEGCSSELWSGFSCAATPTTAVNTVCQQYAETAYEQAKAIQSMVQAGECRWQDDSGNINPRWTTDKARHFAWCASVRPSGAGPINGETNERNRILKTVCKPKSTKVVSKPGSAAPAPAPSPKCTSMVTITNRDCINGDGTPMRSNPPGALKTYGCSTSEAQALLNAKLAFYANNGPCLSEGDDPSPGCCTYKKVTSPVCNCPTHVLSYSPNKGTCSGQRPVGTWPYCCPANAAFSNGVCKPIILTGHSKDKTQSKATGKAPPHGLAGTWLTKTDEGRNFELVMSSNGKTWTGTFTGANPNYNGTLTGTIGGALLNFTYKQPRIGVTGHGSLMVLGVTGGDTFVGKMIADNAPKNEHTWNGARKGTSATIIPPRHCVSPKITASDGSCVCPSGLTGPNCSVVVVH